MENQIIIRETPFDDTINGMPETLIKLADDEADAALKDKLYELAQQVSPTIDGMDDEEFTRAKIANVKLKHGVGGEDAPENTKVGQIYSDRQELFDKEFSFIPLYNHRSRAYFAPGAGNKPECTSLDGQVGNKYGDCKTCPYSQYEEGKSSECKSGRTVYALASDLSGLYRINFSKTSLKAGEQMVKNFRAPAAYAFHQTLGVDKGVQQQGNKATYFFFTTKRGDKVDPKTYELCKVLVPYFAAGHKKSKFIRDEKLKLTGGTQAPANGTTMNALDTHGESAPNTDAIDFSESV